MTDYSGDDYGREQDRHDQQPSGDWTAPGSTPEYPPSYGTDHGGDVPGQSQGYGGQAYGAGNGRYGDAVAPMGAAPSGAMTRVGPGGVPELWPGPIPLRPMIAVVPGRSEARSHCFTAPMVRPCTMYLRMTMPRSSIGATVTTPAAMI